MDKKQLKEFKHVWQQSTNGGEYPSDRVEAFISSIEAESTRRGQIALFNRIWNAAFNPNEKGFEESMLYMVRELRKIRKELTGDPQ